jgi:hypothetical protein
MGSLVKMASLLLAIKTSLLLLPFGVAWQASETGAPPTFLLVSAASKNPSMLAASNSIYLGRTEDSVGLGIWLDY